MYIVYTRSYCRKWSAASGDHLLFVIFRSNIMSHIIVKGHKIIENAYTTNRP